MALITLYRGEDEAIVEAGSQSEADLRDLGFGDTTSAPSAKTTWPLKSTTPAEYIEQHGEDEELSDTVAERLALARELVAAEG